MNTLKKVCIWIDGDSCPTLVREFVFKYATNRTLPVKFVSNKKKLFGDNSQFEVTVESTGKDATDNYILENAKSGDLIITKDVPFAARAIEKNISVMNDRGTLFTKDNIAQKLSDRNFDLSLSEIGFKSPRAKNYGKTEFGKFVPVFEKEMKHLVNESYMKIEN